MSSSRDSAQSQAKCAGTIGGTSHTVNCHMERRNERTIGSPITWENFGTRFDGVKWTEPEPLPASAASIEKNPALPPTCWVRNSGNGWNNN